MLDELKPMISLVVELFEGSGFFYEYGVVKSLLVIAAYGSIALLLARGGIVDAARRIEIFPELWIGLIGGGVAFLYLKNISMANYAYFYPPTTGHRIENILGLSIIYGIAMAVYYSFYSAVFHNTKKILAFICVAAIITSPLQMWVLFSSSTRDFIRAPILTLFFMLIIYTVRQKINYTNRVIFFCSALMVCAMTFRQEIILYFPLLIMAIIIFHDDAIKNRLLIALKMITFFIPGYLFVTSGLHSLERASGRFIPGLSEDVIRAFYGEPSSYIGPFNDQTATVFNTIRQTVETGLSFPSYEKITFLVSLVFEYCLRLPTVLVGTYELPMSSNFYPPFFESTWIGQALSYARAVFSENYFFVLAFIFMAWGLRSNKKLCIFLFFSAIYLSIFNGLQFFSKNIFHLELFSYFILIFGTYHAIVFSKKISKLVLRVKP